MGERRRVDVEQVDRDERRGVDVVDAPLDGERRVLREVVTNDDGRTDGPILPEGEFRTGRYELVFHVGAWLDSHHDAPSPRFLDEVPIRFGMAEPSHYHVPLLISPYGYSTYRGS